MRVTVTVPASTANLGPGFDALGMALTLHNRITLVADGWSDSPHGMDVTFSITGEGETSLAKTSDNLVYKVAASVFAGHGRFPQNLHIALDNAIPLARGLGSSAAATVGSLLAAHATLGVEPAWSELLALASAYEGHVDNAAAALLGGATLAAMRPEGPAVVRITPPGGLTLVVAVPAFSLRTSEARRALPLSVPLADAVHNLSRTAFVWSALERGDWEALRWAMVDRLHEPYRERLVPGFTAVCRAAVEAGALSAVLSGAGPTVIAFVTPEFSGALPSAVGEAMNAAFHQAGVSSRHMLLNPDVDGASVALEGR